VNSKLKESRLVYKSAYLEVYEDLLKINSKQEGKQDNNIHNDDNNLKIFQRIKTTHDNAAVIPILFDGSLLMVESYRYGVDKVLLEFPGGTIEENEEPIKTARKELLQETGYQSKALEYKGWFYTWPAKMNQKIHLFLAKALEKVSEQDLEETESIKVKIIPEEELIAKLKNHEIKSAIAITALFYGYILDTRLNRQ
jgi:ADP-ribose pyrophosphatase